MTTRRFSTGIATAAALIIEEVEAWRLRCARELFLACGVPMHEASTRSMLLYAYVFGVSMMKSKAGSPRPLIFGRMPA